MSEEINEEQPEVVEEKSLEDEIAALEDVASTLEAETEVKSEDETEVKSEDGEESESEEKAEEGETEEKARQHPVATGYPHDRVEMQPGPPEFDEEEDEKNWEGPKKRRVVVVEMDPDEITDDMKAYVVDIPDEDEEEDGEGGGDLVELRRGRTHRSRLRREPERRICPHQPRDVHGWARRQRRAHRALALGVWRAGEPRSQYADAARRRSPGDLLHQLR